MNEEEGDVLACNLDNRIDRVVKRATLDSILAQSDVLYFFLYQSEIQQQRKNS